MVSIIIPTYNRCDQLIKTLQSLGSLKTSFDFYEIIVVDNGSTDSTAIVVEQHAKNNPDCQIRYYYDKEPGLLTGRHRGAFESNGDILTFIDDDVLVSLKWLDTIIEVMSSGSDIVFLTGPALPFYESYPPDWLDYFWGPTPYGGMSCMWLSLLDIGNHIIEIHPTYVWGLNFTIKKSALYDLGGFHPDNISPEFQIFQGDGETGLAVKGKEKGYKALYHPGAMLYHNIPSGRLTADYFGKRAFYQGVCDSYTQLRKNNGEQSVNHALNWKGEIIQKFIDTKKMVVGTIKKRYSVKNLTPVLKQASEHKEEMLRFTKERYDAGFKFHQDAFSNSEKVRNWVLRENYFDYHLPK
jgi:glucosyl-dolichyl phosphate glucuronosyltransferase